MRDQSGMQLKKSCLRNPPNWAKISWYIGLQKVWGNATESRADTNGGKPPNLSPDINSPALGVISAFHPTARRV